MKNIIEALQILLRNGGISAFPFHCEHDDLRVWPGIKPTDLSIEDRKRLQELGFDESHECGLVWPCDLDESDERYSSEYEDPAALVWEDPEDPGECYSECGWHLFAYGSC